MADEIRSNIPPLVNGVPIVNKDTGAPSPQFIRLWQQLFGNNDLAFTNIDELRQLIEDKVDESRQILTTDGLQGGGDLTTDRTLSLTDTGATPGTYGDATNIPQLTVDAKGRITAITDVPASGGGTGNSQWELLATSTISAPVANVDINNLGNNTDLMVIVRNVTLVTNGTRNIQFSVDNGATFFTASTDYRTITAGGTEASASSISLHDNVTTSARSGWMILHGANDTSSSVRFVLRNAAGAGMFFLGSGVVNAIRLIGSGGGNITAGTILVFGRQNT